MTQFRTTKVYEGDDGHSVIVEGAIENGCIEAGMQLNIGMSATFSMSVPIRSASSDGKSLVLECEDREGVDMVIAMNFENELLEATEPN